MTRAPIIEHDTWLFSDEAPTGRLFAAGSAHPGEGWADEPTACDAPFAADGTDLLAAQAEKFDKAWADAMREREGLDRENADLRASITSRDEDIRQLTEKLADVNVQLGAANLKIAEQAEQIAKFDKDGDGKPGGGAPKLQK